MKLGKHQERRARNSDFKRILGRIYVPRHAEGGRQPYLELKDGANIVPLQAIIDMVRNAPEATDYDLVGQAKIAGLRPDDVQSVRAYIHRFGADVRCPFPIEHHENHVLLLDENIPQSAMLSLSVVFGWSTHVAAENLAGQNTPDRDILRFGCRHSFSALVTRDSDFIAMYRQFDSEADVEDGPVPVLLFIPDNTDDQRLSEMFNLHSGALKDIFRHSRKLAYRLNVAEGVVQLF